VLTDLFDEVFGADELADATVSPDGAAARWRIRFADNRATILTVAPPMSAVEVRARYPDASAIEPLELATQSTIVPIANRQYERRLTEWPTIAVAAEAADLRRVQADVAAVGLDALARDIGVEAAVIEEMIRDRSAAARASPTCATCRSASRYGNCGRPVEAGISERFELVRHPASGRGCRVHEGADR
jgi:hypothetical protein